MHEKRKKNRNWAIVTVIAIIIVLLATSLTHKKESNKLSIENEELKETLTKKEKKWINQRDKLMKNNNENEDEKDGGESEMEKLNKDTEWFVKEIYEGISREKMYQNIHQSITPNLEENLFGEEIPEIDEETKTDEDLDDLYLDNEQTEIVYEVLNVEVYGDYKDEETYKSLVLFDLEVETDERTDAEEKIVEVEIIKDDEGKYWLFNQFEEKSSQNK